MKSCTYCGQAYPDEAEVCVIDRQPLQLAIAPQTVPGAEGKNSTLGLVSLTISIAVGCLMLGAFTLGSLLTGGRVQHGQTYPGQMIVGLFVIFLWAVDVVALGLGIGALCQEGRKPLYGVLGVVFSSATIVGSIGLIVLGLMFGAGVLK